MTTDHKHISTTLTSTFGVTHPIISAPMCGMAMGKLAGSVVFAGGIGLIGVGSAKILGPERIREEYRIAQEIAGNKYPGALGFGFLENSMNDDDDESFEICMSLQPDVVFLSGFSLPPNTGPDKFPAYQKWIKRAREKCSEAKIIVQAFTVKEAVLAARFGADAVAIHGCDAGGHGRQNLGASIISLIPQTRMALDEAGMSHCILIGAGGIATGRQMAAALVLGADGVLMGSAFVITEESLAEDSFKQRIVDAKDGTSSTAVSDVWDYLSSWGELYFTRGQFMGRALSDSDAYRKFQVSKDISDSDKEWYAKSDYSTQAVWCSTSVGLLNKGQIKAGDLVTRTVGQAIEALNAQACFSVNK